MFLKGAILFTVFRVLISVLFVKTIDVKREVNYYMKKKEIPILFIRKEECCGCTACYAICPKGAISMELDEEGFEYPQIDEEKCIGCYICLKVCPIKEKISTR